MATLAIQLTLADYAAWKSIFDTRKQFRKDKMGVKSEHLYLSADNPNEILLWFDVLDAANIRGENSERRRPKNDAGGWRGWPTENSCNQLSYRSERPCSRSGGMRRAGRRPLMGWSGRAPAPPATNLARGAKDKGAPHVPPSQQHDQRNRHRYW